MRAGIALGSNLGDREAHLRWAIRQLQEIGSPPLKVSRFYETEPIDCPPDSPGFLNAALEFSYAGSAENLLKITQHLEQQRGRQKSIRNAPRPLDLDILYLGDQSLDSPGLQVPHPRIQERLFVLCPLCDIAPDRILPGDHLSIRERCAKLKSSIPTELHPQPTSQ